MDKYIKADDLLDAIYPLDPENDGSDGCTVVARPQTLTSEELEAMIDSLPAADVAPVVHAKWINHGSFVTCSHCGEEQYGIDTGRFYCQNCGAKMDLEE